MTDFICLLLTLQTTAGCTAGNKTVKSFTLSLRRQQVGSLISKTKTRKVVVVWRACVRACSILAVAVVGAVVIVVWWR